MEMAMGLDPITGKVSFVAFDAQSKEKVGDVRADNGEPEVWMGASPSVPASLGHLRPLTSAIAVAGCHAGPCRAAAAGFGNGKDCEQPTPLLPARIGHPARRPTRDHYGECRGRGCASLFLAPTGIAGFCPVLVRVTRDLFFGEGTILPTAVAIAVPVLDPRGGFEAARVGGSALAGSAISRPNKAATLLPSSIFAALGVAFANVRSCPAPAINSFSSTPRSTKSS